MNDKRCVTFAEISICVAIIAILWLLGAKYVSNTLERANASEGLIVLNTLRKAQMRYYTENGKFTGSVSDLDLDVELKAPKFFKHVTAQYTPSYNSTAEIGYIVRNNFAYQLSRIPYTLHIDVEGNIWCTSDSDVCKRIGLVTSNF